MRVIARRTLLEFVEGKRRAVHYAALKGAVDAWFAEASKANRRDMADIRARYVTASVVNSERVVFNIKGNDYRLVVAIDFERSIAWIKWIGTHKDYVKIDVRKVEYNGRNQTNPKHQRL
jgi:mRNA interferase HigB